MREQSLQILNQLLKNISVHYSLQVNEAHYSRRKEVFNKLNEIEPEMASCLSDFIMTVDAYEFTRQDKMLKIKAADIYQLEMERIKDDLQKYGNTIKEKFRDKQSSHLIDSLI